MKIVKKTDKLLVLERKELGGLVLSIGGLAIGAWMLYQSLGYPIGISHILAPLLVIASVYGIWVSPTSTLITFDKGSGKVTWEGRRLFGKSMKSRDLSDITGISFQKILQSENKYRSVGKDRKRVISGTKRSEAFRIFADTKDGEIQIVHSAMTILSGSKLKEIAETIADFLGVPFSLRKTEKEWKY